MPVIDQSQYAGIHRGLGAVKTELEKLNSKVDKLLKSEEPGQVRTEYSNGFELKTKDRVVWWTKVDNAARYRLILNFNIDEVGSLDLDRETRFYVFDKMPKGIYILVKVIAEDREGNEIVSASIGL